MYKYHHYWLIILWFILVCYHSDWFLPYLSYGTFYLTWFTLTFTLTLNSSLLFSQSLTLYQNILVAKELVFKKEPFTMKLCVYKIQFLLQTWYQQPCINKASFDDNTPSTMNGCNSTLVIILWNQQFTELVRSPSQWSTTQRNEETIFSCLPSISVISL